MPINAASDDLKVVDGKTVIYLNLRERKGPGDRLRLSGPRRDAAGAAPSHTGGS